MRRNFLNSNIRVQIYYLIYLISFLTNKFFKGNIYSDLKLDGMSDINYPIGTN